MARHQTACQELEIRILSPTGDMSTIVDGTHAIRTQFRCLVQFFLLDLGILQSQHALWQVQNEWLFFRPSICYRIFAFISRIMSSSLCKSVKAQRTRWGFGSGLNPLEIEKILRSMLLTVTKQTMRRVIIRRRPDQTESIQFSIRLDTSPLHVYLLLVFRHRPLQNDGPPRFPLSLGTENRCRCRRRETQ